jgi:hypothetical protein
MAQFLPILVQVISPYFITLLSATDQKIFIGIRMFDFHVNCLGMAAKIVTSL